MENHHVVVRQKLQLVVVLVLVGQKRWKTILLLNGRRLEGLRKLSLYDHSRQLDHVFPTIAKTHEPH